MSKPAAEELYSAIRERFNSRLGCGPDHDEPWWDWLALWSEDFVRRVAEEAQQPFRAEAEMVRAEHGWKRDGRGLVELIAERVSAYESELSAAREQVRRLTGLLRRCEGFVDIEEGC